MKRITTAALGIALAASATSTSGCATRIQSGVYHDVDGSPLNPYEADFAVPPDFATPPDFIPPVTDLAVPGKNCGQIMKCVVGCGAMLGGCQAMCLQGASPKGLQQAGAILVCAGQNCILNMRDGGGQADILTCMISHCANQIGDCDGFGFGGF